MAVQLTLRPRRKERKNVPWSSWEWVSPLGEFTRNGGTCIGFDGKTGNWIMIMGTESLTTSGADITGNIASCCGQSAVVLPSP